MIPVIKLGLFPFNSWRSPSEILILSSIRCSETRDEEDIEFATFRDSLIIRCIIYVSIPVTMRV